MNRLRPGFIALAMLVYAGSANATFYYYFGADEPTDSGVANTTTDGDAVSIALAEAAWERQVAMLYPTVTLANFKTNAANVKASTGINAVSDAVNNANLSNPATPTGVGSDHSNGTSGLATFNAIPANLTPGFTIQATEVLNGNHSGVFFNDVPAGKGPKTEAGWENKLSIGKFNGFTSASGLDRTDYDNDDFQFEVTGGDALYAFSFRLINNEKHAGSNESLDVVTAGAISKTVHFGDDSNDGVNGMDGLMLDAAGNIVEPGDPDGVVTISGTNTDVPGYVGDEGEGEVLFDHDNNPDTPKIPVSANFVHESFIGIVTDDISEVFSFLNFNEGSGVNDIGIFDFRFAVVPVPLPAGVWLLISGLVALFGLGRKRTTDKV